MQESEPQAGIGPHRHRWSVQELGRAGQLQRPVLLRWYKVSLEHLKLTSLGLPASGKDCRSCMEVVCPRSSDGPEGLGTGVNWGAAIAKTAPQGRVLVSWMLIGAAHGRRGLARLRGLGEASASSGVFEAQAPSATGATPHGIAGASAHPICCRACSEAGHQVQADARHRLLAETLERVFKSGFLDHLCGVLGGYVRAWRSSSPSVGWPAPLWRKLGAPFEPGLAAVPAVTDGVTARLARLRPTSETA